MSLQTTPLISLGPLTKFFQNLVSKVGNTGLRSITGTPLSSTSRQVANTITPIKSSQKIAQVRELFSVGKATKATIATVAASGAIFSATGGPEIVKSSTEFGTATLQAANNVTEFFSKNPLIAVGIVILGGILVLGVVSRK